MRRQFFQPVLGMRVDARQHIAQVGARIHAGAVHAPLGSGLHRCPPVRIGGHHRPGHLGAVQDGTAGRSPYSVGVELACKVRRSRVIHHIGPIACIAGARARSRSAISAASSAVGAPRGVRVQITLYEAPFGKTRRRQARRAEPAASRAAVPHQRDAECRKAQFYGVRR